ncbi:SGNH/GDSL hydrolase family protein [Dapis sp. BLCC M172]|uniref:SGNH/GDSL hydrolase family protein n=1 Tax=Dapis sp. BLCC M172 TaxID=2975281 RepID=UPI003CE924C4
MKNNIISVSMALTASALTIGTTPVYAANSNLDFSQMFIFGDSLLDTENAFTLTKGQFPDSPLSFEGRFSNGPIWIESLASSLDLAPTAFFTNIPISPDGANYAISGSRSGDQNILDNFPLGLEQQLGSFIAPLLETEQSANSDALYTIWTGANDYLHSTLSLVSESISPPDAPPNSDTTVNNITNSIEALYNVGARDFLIPNLPSLGLTPLATFTGTSDILNQLTNEHNQKLELAIAELEQSLSEATITLLDVNSTLDEIINNPNQFGFSNATDSWSDTVLAFCSDASLGADGSVKSCDVDVPDPDEYLFWDILHPTEAAHQIIGNEALYALKSEYNQTVPEPTSILSLLGLGFSLLGVSAFKQKDKQTQKQKV